MFLFSRDGAPSMSVRVSAARRVSVNQGRTVNAITTIITYPASPKIIMGARQL